MFRAGSRMRLMDFSEVVEEDMAKSWASSSSGKGCCFAPASSSSSGSSSAGARCYEVLEADSCLLETSDSLSDDLICCESLACSGPMALRPASESAPAEPPGCSMLTMFAEEQLGASCRPPSDLLCCAAFGVSAAERASAVDGLTRAATALGLSSEVLFLGVSCLDRCLASGAIGAAGHDMSALACLWVAAKYERVVVAPAARFLAAAHRDAASPTARRALVDAEARVLQALDYRVAPYPNAKAFLRAIFQRLQHQHDAAAARAGGDGAADAKALPGAAAALYKADAAAGGKAPDAAAEQQQQQQQRAARLYFCASYLCEMSLLECKLAAFAPSQVAAAAFASASLLVDAASALPDAQLQALTGYALADVKLPMQWLLSVHHVLYQGRHLPRDSMYETARKYRHAAFLRVGLVPSISSTADPRLRLGSHGSDVGNGNGNGGGCAQQ